ncbi:MULTISPECIES: D-alanyl-D-alanine carboxypeptidase family protein [Brevibacillus]|jgi:D-alanyl-D-alanine carboxypeptidase/D-alanyl-D-alanine carboxypeptidase (penicillin-binding protein 5/6)|uniref:Peptidase S11 family protein n=1 Tax=Brevibacillus borstelensis AK1 TaxID=1300222 RepID=M8DC01_9BACL|nr:D-alanyl-D-alanine carboxypeptidase family protein [Brevibacillus borstelensis]EMT50887.1 peptidase S11 family protein precursor [Brevibacillus borstelensis AK1]MCC0564167.1 D-alanyl-D-alanine carboxypeptidase [Brevibacillus borstelensis]MCM3470715.1 D-alanyl-D-alanine carboxypeptidase [Brevibacillus borstelensis]MCM3558943.1 D-alanyl-D-alanine carboxypeptidase [Brevibacillus borstelensis]MCM3593717.1 D-alanyl-D-alanine carboxypeptidase [Brevibacillus borstelensis]
MRYLLICLLAVACVFSTTAVQQVKAQEGSAVLSPEQISGESAILIDAKTGQVLFEKNSHAKLYPASITKIATGIYAIENGNPDDIVTVSKRARWEEGTRVYLAEGEQVTLKKLEYGLLMNSGNDAATAIAEHLSGTVEQFAERLNAYLVEKVGIEETHFTNAHGLHDPNHYTTAADMAKIAQYAMQNPIFREIVATERLPWDGLEWQTVLVNHNKLLRNYEGATGIKNGFTDQARNTLVGSAKRGDTEFIAVTMKAGSSNLSYKDVTAMLDYGFAHFETKQIAHAGQAFTRAKQSIQQTSQEEAPTYTADSDLYATVPLGTTPETEVTADGQLIVRAGELSRTYALKRKEEPRVAAAASKEEPESVPTGPRYGILFTWLGLNLFLVTYTVARARKRRRQRMRQIPRNWSRMQ